MELRSRSIELLHLHYSSESTFRTSLRRIFPPCCAGRIARGSHDARLAHRTIDPRRISIAVIPVIWWGCQGTMIHTSISGPPTRHAHEPLYLRSLDG
ncbi:hypothetical protein BDM02DRAFT_2447259 [Thelephora ganbajun]|uniref:Uncharacterized protein n=1 Tax=Thelephora ganbajun TaxID=370292 RepID=A0ACB6YYX2_THEGA|nr:hypothetical protein BDM02DRAFT_2447259 [Thelephora ganbajun]